MGHCNDIYNTDITMGSLCNVPHYQGKQPYGNYNALGELQGYYWYYGDTVCLTFNIDGNITVENNSIVYYAAGQEPTVETVGELNQKAFNVIDLKSWTCQGIEGAEYIWVEDTTFTYPENGGKEVYFTAENYLRGKKATISIFNFRYEKVLERTLNASTRVSLEIDKETSSKLGKGTYYLTLQVADELTLTYIPVIKDKDCMITVR